MQIRPSIFGIFLGDMPYPVIKEYVSPDRDA
jgi:hypothetical protein